MKLSEFIEKYGDKKIDETELSKIIIEEEKYFIPKLGESYWFVSSNGIVGYNSWEDDSVDKFVYSHQRVFRTQEEAEYEASRQRFLLQMERDFLDNSDELDWVDNHQKKFRLEYNYKNERIYIEYNFFVNEGTLYTTNEEWIEQYIKDNEENIKKYYFGEKDL